MKEMSLVAILAALDGIGASGTMLHYALTIFFVGSAFLIFLFLWQRGKLDMDEEPKMKMMEEEDGRG